MRPPVIIDVPANELTEALPRTFSYFDHMSRNFKVDWEEETAAYLTISEMMDKIDEDEEDRSSYYRPALTLHSIDGNMEIYKHLRLIPLSLPIYVHLN